MMQVADPGERLVLTLPDGSHVELNSGSRLRYARRFGNVRSVHLLGEAFFGVAEEERPFVVETFDAEIRVLGTRFGVRAWPGGLEEGTTVALETGRVALAPVGQPERAVEMERGETRRLATGAADVDLHGLPGVSVDDATAWRRGDLVFKDQLLGIVMEDVERRYAVDIRVHPDRLQHKRLNLALRRPESAEAVVRDLALALGLAYRETSTGFELFEDPAPGANP